MGLMKQRSITPTVSIKSLAAKSTLVAAAVLMAMSAPMSIGPVADARDYDAEIGALKNQINGLQNEAGKLRQRADSLQTEISKLQAEQRTIQAQIQLSQAKREKLANDILETERKIEQNALVTGEIINDMAISDDEPLFMQLATSDNLADVIDTFENQLSIQKELKRSTDETKKLKKELEVQKAEVDRVIADQENQRAQLASKQAEQNQLLEETRGEEAAYKKLAAEKNAQVTELQQQQAAELAARAQNYGGGYTNLPGDGSRGGYPSMWANAPMNAYVDSWGMYTRQCVSYTAFKVQQAYGNMPYWGGVGNANQWDDNARRMGIPTGSTPKPGSVAIVNAGTYGHSAWVESVNADGTINISHFNVGWSGEYAYWANLSPAYFDTYIYFGEW